MTDQRIYEILKKSLSDNLHFKTEGGLHGKTEIWGTFGDVLDFVKAIYEEGYDEGCYETSHFTGYTGLFGEPQ